MSAGNAAGSSGNTGADQGFFNSEQAKKDKTKNTGADQGFFNSEEQKVNDSLMGNADYQGDVNPNAQKNKKKNTTTYNDGGGNGGEGNNTIVNKTVGGTKIQTTKAKVEKAADLTAEQILLRNKKRGRKMTMMSGAKGVTKTSSDYSLGKKSLLGIV